jgi:dsRNA-specific ribonuclease
MKLTPVNKIKTEFAKLTSAEQRELVADLAQIVHLAGNPIVALGAEVQKQFGANMTTEVWIEGASHVPVVYCKFVLPNGTEYIASGKNQKVAKHLAAEQALADLQKAQ